MVSYFIDLIILTESKNALFIREKTNNPNFKHTYGGTTYNVKEGALFEKPSRIPQLNLLYWIIGWRYYYIIFIEGKGDPVLPGNPKFSPQEIYLINNSTILGKALKGLIAKALSNRLLIIGIVVLSVVIYYLLTSGGYVTV